MGRQSMSRQEREIRSRLAELVHAQQMLPGTLTVRRMTCGRKSCRCYQGEKHEALYLAFQRDGKSYQVCIPKRLESQARQWSDNYRRGLELLEDICQQGYQQLLLDKQRRPKPS